MAVMTVVIVFITGPFSRIFMDVDTPDADQVLPLAQSLLVLAALFQLGDGVQAVAAGALRGVNDTKVPMLNAVVTFWGLGAAVSLGLGFPGGMETQGVWIGFVVSLTVVVSYYLGMTSGIGGAGRNAGLFGRCMGAADRKQSGSSYNESVSGRAPRTGAPECAHPRTRR